MNRTALTVESETPETETPRLGGWGRVLSWIYCLVILLMTIWGIARRWTELGTDNPLFLAGELFFEVFPLTYTLLGVLIVSRQPQNAVGWLMMLPALANIFSTIGDFLLGSQPPTTVTIGIWLAALLTGGSWVWYIFPLLIILLLFPTGRPPTARWNWVIWQAILMIVFFYGVASLGETFDVVGDGSGVVKNPIGVIPSIWIDTIFNWPWVLALLLLTIACVAALVVRFQRGTSTERVQIKWVLYASALFGIIYVIALFWTGFEGNDSLTSFFNILFGLSSLAIPVSMAIAIFRYRLYAIDLIIRRTVVWAIISGLGLGLYLLAVGATSFFLGSQTDYVIPLVALVLVALIARPLYQKLDSLLNQRFPLSSQSLDESE